MSLKGMKDLSLDKFLEPSENPEALKCFTP